MSTIFDEFCRETTAFINPTDCIKPLSEFPEICITTFSQNIITEFIENNNTKIIANLYSANGILPVYEIKYDDASVGVFLSRVGAPACVVGLEEIIALGAKKIIQSEVVEHSISRQQKTRLLFQPLPLEMKEQVTII